MALSVTLPPRLVIAGTQSGVGKTTVATGLVAALRAAGHTVAAAKVGPDYIDPGYHSLASGRPPRNLDPWLCGADAVAPLAGRAAEGADVLIVEGVMGLFDGAADGTPSSTADVARMISAPVVLVIDAAAQSRSVAAVVHGFATFEDSVDLAGVILNRVGSETHEIQLREALEPSGVTVLGALRRDDRLVWRDRHLGLVPVAEEPDAVGDALTRLAAIVADSIDLAQVMQVASRAKPMRVGAPPLPDPVTGAEGGMRIAVAAGRAFTFTYTDTLDALRATGAEPVPFDPMTDADLPDGTSGMIVGGGFPEVHAAALADNVALITRVRDAIAGGLPVWAECGGLLWLSRSLDGAPLVGAVPTDAAMGTRLHLGYRTATTTGESPIGSPGTVLRGHEFHYSTVVPDGGALTLASRWGERGDGFATPMLLATYLHHHPGGDPGPVAAFVRTCASVRDASVRD